VPLAARSRCGNYCRPPPERAASLFRHSRCERAQSIGSSRANQRLRRQSRSCRCWRCKRRKTRTASSRRPRRMGRSPSFQPFAPFRRKERGRQRLAILPGGNPTACNPRLRDGARRFAGGLRWPAACNSRQRRLSRSQSRHPWQEHPGLEDRRRCPCWLLRQQRRLPHWLNRLLLSRHGLRFLPDRHLPSRRRSWPFPRSLPCHLRRPCHRSLDRFVRRVRSSPSGFRRCSKMRPLSAPSLVAWWCRKKPRPRVPAGAPTGSRS
jgi:hypothetical protein